MRIPIQVAGSHLSCGGLASNWDKCYDLLCDIHSNEFSFDFIGISEVFRCYFDVSVYRYIIYRCRDQTDDSRGGAALLIKKSFDLSVFIQHIYESLVV